MANVILAFPNEADNTGTTLSGGSWLAAQPLTNLADDRLSRVARSTNATAAFTQFDVDLTYSAAVRVFSFYKHNFSRFASIRIRGSTVSTFASTVYDSGYKDAWPVVYPLYTPPVGGPGWLDGRLTDTEASGYNLHSTVVASTRYTARYWRFEILDTGNTAGYVQFARLVMSPAWQPTINMSLGATNGWTTETSFTRSEAGPKAFAVRPRARTSTITLENIDEESAMIYAFEMQRQLGLHGQLLFVFDPDDTLQSLRRTFLANLTQLQPLQVFALDLHTSAISLEEVL